MIAPPELDATPRGAQLAGPFKKLAVVYVVSSTLLLSHGAFARQPPTDAEIILMSGNAVNRLNNSFGRYLPAPRAVKCVCRQTDCVLIGAGLRAPEHLRRFEKLLNPVHVEAPNARICFNTTPADSAEAVQHWI